MLLSILIGMGITGCGCKEELIDVFLLSNHEKSLISFEGYQDLLYVNEKGQQIKATTQPRKVSLDKVTRGPESCEYREFEVINNFINFFDNGFSIKLKMEASGKDRTRFSLTYTIPESNNSKNEYFQDIINPSNEQLIDIELNGFKFSNVYDFKNNFLNKDSKIERVLYSSEGRGVEMISFKDGKYIKLMK